MSTTGIVRRIDDLGRIVIPKEIRKSLRIKDGESLEIEVENDSILLKKYSAVTDMYSFLSIIVDAINKIIDKSIFVFNRDKFIYASTENSSLYSNQGISDQLFELMNDRNNEYLSSGELLITKEKAVSGNYLFSSIIPNGDVEGGVLILSETGEITEIDRTFLKVIVEILRKYIEE